jgi:hypothetical protein
MKKIIFPEFTEYPKESLPIQNSIRLRKSIRGILTIFNTYKITIDTNTFVNPQTIDFGEALQNIENHIKTLILHYSKNQEDEILKEIFHYIHFWGGVTGRGIYVQKGGFEMNFKIDTYKEIVDKIIVLKQDTLCEDLKEIEKLFISIPYIGVAYGTKHLRFWSINANENKIELPILDSIISKNILITPYFAWRHYCSYVIQMQKEAKKSSVSVSALERALYNKFN